MAASPFDDPAANGDLTPGDGHGDAPGARVVCATCHQPLVRQGDQGVCVYCLVNFASDQGDDALEEEPSTNHPFANKPRRYGHFEILNGADGSSVELGHGAMGTTYRAQDTVLHRAVALKVIDRSVAQHSAARERFLREARAAAQFQHPNVATVSHYGEQDGECFYAMELVEGETLEARVRREGPLPVTLTLAIAVQVTKALVAAEARGIIHRDLKPTNLMLSIPDGEPEGVPLVKVIDFGLAKAVTAAASAEGAFQTRAGFVGTPAFASPEQFARSEENRIDHRADIYSLGVTMWYALCGRVPFAGRTLEEIHSRQIDSPLPVEQLDPARVPAPMVSLLRTMLAVDPGARPQSARALLEALQRSSADLAVTPSAGNARRRPFRRLAVVLGLLLVLAAAVGMAWYYFGSRFVPADKSIAVLPFENSDSSPVGAVFTKGVRDGVASNLARIAELKVTGPASVAGYPPGHRDLRAIGRALGVKQILEGEATRDGEQIHVHVWLTQLGDAAPVWEGRYDRRLSDVFTIQSEITRTVADRLGVEPSQAEAALINEPPTRSLAAYDLFLRAKERTQVAANPAGVRAAQLVLIDRMTEVLKLEPGFINAYCTLAGAHDEYDHYLQGAMAEERSVDHRALAETALLEARRMQPDSGLVHLAQAVHILYVGRNREQARIELDLARRSLPNHSNLQRYIGIIARLDGRWDEALHAFLKAAEIEPREPVRWGDLASTYGNLRDYPGFDGAVAKMMALTSPGEVAEFPLYRARGPLEGRAELAPLRAALNDLRDSDDPGGIVRDYYALMLHLFEHDSSEATRSLTVSRQSQYLMNDFAYPKAWFQALVARMRKDDAAAQAAFSAARVEVERTVLADPQDERNLLLLAMIDAGLGRREEAVREARRACAMEPKNQEAVNHPSDRCGLAVVYAWTDQPDLALAELSDLVARPAGDNFFDQPTYGDLKLNPMWDPLRGDQRFASLVERLAPLPARLPTGK